MRRPPPLPHAPRTPFRALLPLVALLLAATGLAQPADGFARIHYERPDGDYEGFELHVWEDTTASVTWADGLDVAGSDAYGVYWDVPLADDARRVGFIVHRGDEKDPGPDMFLEPATHGREIWLRSGSEEILTSPPLPPVAEGEARLHYHRPDGDYEGWTLHVWDGAATPTEWAAGLEPSGTTPYGLYWDVPLAEGADALAFIVHRGDEKDPGPDMLLDLDAVGSEAWLVSGSAEVAAARPDLRAPSAGDLGRARAHWVAPDLILWDVGDPTPGTRFRLHAAADGVLEAGPEGVRGGEAVELTLDPAGPHAELVARAPHLAGLDALRLDAADAARAAEWLRGRVAVSMVREGRALDATSLQIPLVLDALYADAASDVDLGPVWDGEVPELRVWAPTARNVALLLERGGAGGAGDGVERVAMTRDEASGVWSVRGEPAWKGAAYRFEVEVYAPEAGAIVTNAVTDPYSVALTTDSRRSVLVDLSDPSLEPEGWGALRKPGLEAPEDAVVYELHLRDFSAGDASVPAEHRGTYLAFTHPDANGMRHLAALAEAGLTHLHLLPTFDIATIPEDPADRVVPDLPSVQVPSASPEPQAALEPVRDLDAFNWGYDPYHYDVPEGSYATDPDGATRTREYRAMVMALDAIGLRVVSDVVYNHTNASGQAERSVLDRIVPGYYHRLDANGAVTTSTCCRNTATEHRMMRKLMVDSVVHWATAYKVDAFRFDLMGHHMVEDMLAVRAALDALTLERDGVDGRGVILYGEGWNFGEVADGARGPNATQFGLAGTGIGTFNDRLRDAVRGGGPFDGGIDLLSRQGFASGLGTLPNRALRTPPEGLADEAARNADLVRLGLAGNLADYAFETASGEVRRGAELDYNGQPAGYALDPQENVVYVSKHDNQTLFDILAYKLPTDLPSSDRARLQTVALSTAVLAQGMPFLHAGSDLLRSKSLDRDSYNSGDRFNAIDWTGATNGFGVGLPPAWSNRDNWNFMRPLLEDPALLPSEADIAATAASLRGLLAVRASSPLFRLRSGEDVRARLAFRNTGPEQVPGVIVMELSDDVDGPDLDPAHERVLVVFNASAERYNARFDHLAGQALLPHPALLAAGDEAMRSAAFYTASGSVSVPPFTTAVFVLPE